MRRCRSAPQRWRWSPILRPARGASLIRPAIVAHDLAPALDEAFRRDKSMPVAGGETASSSSTCSIRRCGSIIVGAVHIAQPLVADGARARLRRGQSSIRAPPSPPRNASASVKIVREWPDEALPKIGVDARTALIALTHDPRIDDPALIQRFASDAFYVGALGSRKTHASARRAPAASGRSARRTSSRIHAPIGLDIGAQGRGRDRALDRRRDHRRATRQGRAMMTIAAIVLAAGRSSRMAPRNKLLERVDGEADRRARRRHRACKRRQACRRGHRLRGRARCRGACAVSNLTIVHNPAFAEGLSTSLRAVWRRCRRIATAR